VEPTEVVLHHVRQLAHDALQIRDESLKDATLL
jgi:hypothetical protein